MSTLVDFVPSSIAPFSFQAEMAGTTYTITVLWNIFGQRYYISIVDLSGTLVLYRALSGSGPVLSAAFTWALGVAMVTTNLPHNLPIGMVDDVIISQTNTGFDGNVQVLSTSPTTLTYLLPSDPSGGATLSGNVQFDLELTGEMGIGTLLFHDDTQQFEYS